MENYKGGSITECTFKAAKLTKTKTLNFVVVGAEEGSVSKGTHRKLGGGFKNMEQRKRQVSSIDIHL